MEIVLYMSITSSKCMFPVNLSSSGHALIFSFCSKMFDWLLMQTLLEGSKENKNIKMYGNSES